MVSNRNQVILRNSWTECEDTLKSIGMRDIEEIQKNQNRREWRDITEFLKSIDFLNGNAELTELGREFFKSKFILNDEALEGEILSSALKRFLPTQAICQLLWGRPNLNRLSVYRLLVLEEYIDSREFKEQDMGGFLMLLNQCSILKYNKKSGSITVLYNPRTSEVEVSTKFLSPETPYSNVRNLREVLREATVFVHWFDKHFSLRGLEPLHDEADGTKVNEIKILSGITSGRINERLRDDFIRFKDEMKTRQIRAEFRVLCNKEILNDIHDRWIVSKNSVFNVPPIDTIFQGQYSEVKKTENRPPFEEWWSNGIDIVDRWQQIQQYIEK